MIILTYIFVLLMSINNFMIDCVWVNTFGIECPGCGFQRSLILFVKGDILASIKMFPAMLPMIILFIALFFHLKFKLKYGARFLTWTFGLTVFVMTGNFTINLIERIYG